uniref:Uncharacterized protein n=1 Tax=Rhodopseudomonas palustris (strain BisA53) TaxID=316055 RepID=Q07TT5_RHOP5
MSMKWILCFAAIVLVVTAAYFIAYPTTFYRFRISIQIETPRGLKSESNVLEVRTRRFPKWTTLGNSGAQSILMGDATFLNLGTDGSGAKKNIVALLALGERAKGIDFKILPGEAFAPILGQLRVDPQADKAMQLSMLPVGTKVVLQGKLIPTLVSFENVNDPYSGTVVQATNLSKTFGDGFNLRDVTLEIVAGGSSWKESFGNSGVSVTRGVEDKLPFLVSHREELRRLMDDMPPRFQPHFFLFKR